MFNYIKNYWKNIAFPYVIVFVLSLMCAIALFVVVIWLAATYLWLIPVACIVNIALIVLFPPYLSWLFKKDMAQKRKRYNW